MLSNGLEWLIEEIIDKWQFIVKSLLQLLGPPWLLQNKLYNVIFFKDKKELINFLSKNSLIFWLLITATINSFIIFGLIVCWTSAYIKNLYYYNQSSYLLSRIWYKCLKNLIIFNIIVLYILLVVLFLEKQKLLESQMALLPLLKLGTSEINACLNCSHRSKIYITK